MAFIDLDEYVMPVKPKTPINIVVDNLLKQHKGAAGVGINWAIFGSSHLKARPKGLITENFIHRGVNNHWGNFHIKTICNPRFIKYYISPHYPLYVVGAYGIGEATGERLYGWFCHNVLYRNIRINHYYTKSYEQFLQKRSRGLGDRLGKYDLEQFNAYDLNDIVDNSMSDYTDALKKNLN